LSVEVYGINGEFIENDVSVSNSIIKWCHNDSTFVSNQLFSENFGTSEFNWQTFKRNIDFSDGYQFILVKFYSEGIKAGPEEEHGIDNVCMPCICQIPQGRLEDELTSNHAMLIWDNVGTNEYHVQYKPVSADTLSGDGWITYTVDNTFYELDSLSANTTYQWQVSANCDGVWTEYSDIREFQTPDIGSSCTSPTDLSTSLITEHQATSTWNEVYDAIEYEISYRASTSVDWITYNTIDNTYNIPSLSAGTAYEWRVKSLCASGWKDYSNTMLFTTLSYRLASESTSTGITSFDIYPNPAQDVITISIVSEESTDATLQITDMLGRKLISNKISLSSGNNQLTADVNTLPRGAYIVHITNGVNMIHNAQLIIE
jgi:hypothetical protein